jgi:hypothetical protein
MLPMYFGDRSSRHQVQEHPRITALGGGIAAQDRFASSSNAGSKDALVM